jgi:hypothetical protein
MKNKKKRFRWKTEEEFRAIVREIEQMTPAEKAKISFDEMSRIFAEAIVLNIKYSKSTDS